MARGRSVQALTVLVGATLAALTVPSTPAFHLGPEQTCTLHRDTIVAGGLPESLIFADPSFFCHIHASCPESLGDDCEFEYSMEITIATGIVHGYVNSDDENNEATCGPAIGTCTATVFGSSNHVAHLNCGAEPLMTGIDVTMTCHIRFLG